MTTTTTTGVYYILSGEGECGTWQRVECDAMTIERRLDDERCCGDRWAKAYRLREMDLMFGNTVQNIEDHEDIRFIPWSVM